MSKFLVLETQTSGDIYGFAYVAIAINDNNVKTLNKLNENFNSIKEIDNEIVSVKYDVTALDFNLLNDEEYFDMNGHQFIIQEISESDIEKLSSDNQNSSSSYRVESPNVEISENFITISWKSKWTHDEVYVNLPKKISVMINAVKGS